jgi:hypothetical protein
VLHQVPGPARQPQQHFGGKLQQVFPVTPSNATGAHAASAKAFMRSIFDAWLHSRPSSTRKQRAAPICRELTHDWLTMLRQQLICVVLMPTMPGKQLR